jgi:hypothetical protein
MRTDLESRNELRKCDKKEVEIEKELELFVYDDGKEGEYVVFLIPNNVWRELGLEFLCGGVSEWITRWRGWRKHTSRAEWYCSRLVIGCSRPARCRRMLFPT